MEDIEALRGLACVLLVYYHVIGPIDGGLKLEAGSFHRVIADAMVHVRMPLFAFISGVIFATQLHRIQTFGKFASGKARRLLIPLVVVGVPVTLLQALGPGVNKQLTVLNALLSVLYPVNHYWFLQSIFLIFLVMWCAARTGVLEVPRRVLFFLVGASALFLSSCWAPKNIFGLNGVMYLLPFFVVGILVLQLSGRLKAIPRWCYITGVLALCLLQLNLAFYNPELALERRNMLSLVVSACACVLLYGLQMKSRFLYVIGGYSFSIYLFHAVFAVGVRLVMTKVGFLDKNLFVLAELLSSLIGPIIIAIVVGRFSWPSMLILGERLRRTSLEGNARKVLASA